MRTYKQWPRQLIVTLLTEYKIKIECVAG